jgi:NitT/TauT family transport system substrate-binding protein
LGLAAGAFVVAPRLASAAEQVSVRLKWLPQAQFAGFYVAKAKGFYDAAGLDLTINPGGPNLNSEALVSAGSDTFGVGGGADSIMAARTKNLPIVALALPFQLAQHAGGAQDVESRVGDFRGKGRDLLHRRAVHALRHAGQRACRNR